MILLIAGTSDARDLGLQIKARGFSQIATVVSPNAAKEWHDAEISVRVGRLTAEKMKDIIAQNQITTIVDASHPFAEEASINAIAAAKHCGIPYIRFERESVRINNPSISYVDSYQEAAELAARKKGVVFLTTGSKTLPVFADKLLPLPDVRMIIRLLPQKENLETCERLHIPQKNIVAMQGPFTKEFNKALFALYKTTVMITKESGKVGSLEEKLTAALELGIDTIIIKRPTVDYGTVYWTFEDVIHHLKGVEREGNHD